MLNDLLTGSRSLLANYHAHGLVKDVFEPLLSECTTLKIATLELILDDSFGSFLLDWCVLWILVLGASIISQVNLVADKDFRNVWAGLVQFRIPLNSTQSTFLRAFTNVGGSTNENVIKKTSQFG